MINEFKYGQTRKIDHLHFVYHFTVPLTVLLQKKQRMQYSQFAVIKRKLNKATNFFKICNAE